MTDRNGQLRGAPSSPEHPSAKLTSEQLAEIRRRHSEGERAAALAVEYGISRAGAFRVVGGYSYNPQVYVPRTDNRRRAAARAAERLTPKPVVVDGSLIAAAKAERGTGVPLVTESLEEKLERHLPGAWVVDSGAHGDERFTVHQRGRYAAREIGSGASRREAIDRAIWLFGSRR